MPFLANILVALVAALHIGFLVLEMFLWTTPFGLRTFNLTPEFAAASAPLAANQGLYNGFLAAGLVWGLFAREAAFSIKVFFLACVIVAGVFGAATAKVTILFIQALPAVLALAAVVGTRRSAANHHRGTR
jgi:putative membrane protein